MITTQQEGRVGGCNSGYLLGGSGPVTVKAALCPAPVSAPQCSDGQDNDGDGKTDYNDPGCYQSGIYNPQDNSETDPVVLPHCSDNQDNDGDGKTDFNDPGCYTNGIYNPQDQSEVNQAVAPQCSDGQDNDGDGKADTQDPGCHSDGNANNTQSYNPQDNDEFNAPVPAGRCRWARQGTRWVRSC